jgi:hypothetical protein
MKMIRISVFYFENQIVKFIDGKRRNFTIIQKSQGLFVYQ